MSEDVVWFCFWLGIFDFVCLLIVFFWREDLVVKELMLLSLDYQLTSHELTPNMFFNQAALFLFA